jgi:Holliday junction resolvase RusA-like endonuclease
VSGALVEFAVHGKPEQRGSKQPFVIYSDRKNKIPARREDGSIMINMTDENVRSKAWMEKVTMAGHRAWKKPPLTGVALDVVVAFFMPRPDGDYGSGRFRGVVKDSAPARPRKTPDLDKLARSTLDALSGVIWEDDKLIVGLTLDEWYAVPKSARDDGQGAMIRVGLAEKQLGSDLDFDQRQRWLEPNDDAATFGQDTLIADAAG